MIYIIIIIALFHFFILNYLEKILYHLYNPNIRKDILIKYLNIPFRLIEVSTIIALLLYYKKYIKLQTVLFIIIVLCLYRIIIDKHSYFAIIISVLFGFFYSYIYGLTGISLKSLLVAFSFYFLYIFLCIIKLNKLMNDSTPDWVDNSLKYIITKKQNVSNTSKLLHITLGSLWINQNYLLYCDWKHLESNLDKLINEIQKTNNIYANLDNCLSYIFKPLFNYTMKYYNTTNEKLDQVKKFTKINNGQDKKILAIIRGLKLPFSASQIWGSYSLKYHPSYWNKPPPITSIRRSIKPRSFITYS